MISKKDHTLLEIICDLGNNAYGVPVRKRFAEHFWFGTSHSKLTARLERLERQGLIVAQLAPPTVPRHDRPRRLYSITERGKDFLNDVPPVAGRQFA